MSDQPAATPAEKPSAAAKAPAAAKPAVEATAPVPQGPVPQGPVNKQPLLRAFVARINDGEFDPGRKDFHQFVVKEIYPLLADGTLTADDLAKLAQAYGVRANPEFKTPA